MHLITIKDGKLNGKSTFYNPDGSVHWEADFTNGTINGYLNIFHENGNTEQMLFIDGVLIETSIQNP
jgi:antitoxin component YwqK of YwqJK toxin-antitoxin module